MPPLHPICIRPADPTPSYPTALLFVTAPCMSQSPSSSPPPTSPQTPPDPLSTPDHTALLIDPPAAPPALPRRRRPPRFSWLGVLLLPRRLAAGALSFLAGAGVAHRADLPDAATLASGCASLAFAQLFISAALRHARRRAEEEAARAMRESARRMAWLDAIQAVGKIVQRFSSGLRGTHAMRHLFVHTSLVRLRHGATAKGYLEAVATRGESSGDVLMAGRYYMEYAFATYGYVLLKLSGVLPPTYNVMVEGSRGVDVVQYMLGLRPEQILVNLLDGEGINVPRHFVALDEVKKTIVVALRGTNSFSDVITDLLCGNEPFAGGYAHAGMKDAAESLFISILPTLRSTLTKHPSYGITVTGHSLGAGVAILLTKVLLMNGFVGVKCYAIAPCPVFGPMHCVDSEWSDALECFVHADDMVARLCLSSARYLALELENMAQIGATVKEKKQIVKMRDAARLEKMIQETRNITRDPRHNDIEKLHIPCHRGVHWLVPQATKDGEKARKHVHEDTENQNLPPSYIPSRPYSSYIVRPKQFERLLVTPGCVSAHFLGSYANALSSLDLPPREPRQTRTRKQNYGKPWYANELG